MLRGTALLLLAFLVLPGFAADDKKDEKKDAKKDEKDVKKDVKDEKKDEKKDPKTEPKKVEPKKDPKVEPKKDNGMVRIGQLVAQVLNVDESKKSLRLRYEVLKLNPGAVQGLAQGQLELQQAYTKPYDQQAQAIRDANRKIAENQLKLYMKDTAEVELITAEDSLVRMKDPPPKFDDKGRPAKHTAKELAELKGSDSKLPGYKGEWADLRTNQLIQVTLVQKRNMPKPKINPKTREIDPDTIADLKPQMSMIVILGDLRQSQ